MSHQFKSVNPAFHDLLNVDYAKASLKTWNHNPDAINLIFDGPDAGTTTTIINHEGYSSLFSSNLVYFQKSSDAAEAQLKKLNSLWKNKNAKHQLKNTSFEHAIDLKSLAATSAAYLPAKENAKSVLSIAFLDSQSFQQRFDLILEKIIALKAYQKDDDSTLTLFCNEIGCASSRKMLMIKSLARTSLAWDAIYNQQLENSNCFSDILTNGHRRILHLAKKYGFGLEPVQLLSETVKATAKEVHYVDDYQSVLYDGGEGTTLMHCFAFQLRRRTFVDVGKVVADVDEDAFDDIVNEDELDYSRFEELQKKCYCNYNVVEVVYKRLLSSLANQKKSIQTIFDRVNNKTPVEVVDIMMNVLLSDWHPDKKVKNLVIHGKERSGKTSWREILQIIADTAEFQNYAKSELSNWSGITVHAISGPNVSVVLPDMLMKSDIFMKCTTGNYRKLQKMPNKKGNVWEKNLIKDPKTPYASGMSKPGIGKLNEIVSFIGTRQNVDSIMLFDEADWLFSGRSACVGELRNILNNPHVKGFVFQTATPYGLLLRDAESRVLYGFTEVFDVLPSEDYRNEYEMIYNLEGFEKFSRDEYNNIHASVEKYLKEDPQDPKYFSNDRSSRAFPIMLMMPCTAVNTESGTMNMGRDLSQGLYQFQNEDDPKPLCIVFCGNVEKFYLFDDGRKIPMEEISIEPKKELQYYLPLVAEKYNFSRHIIVFGYNVMRRGVTSQFFWESPDNSQRVLGVPSHVTCVIKPSGESYRRAIGDMRQMIRRYPVCLQDFIVPFFENYKCQLTCNQDLMMSIEKYEKDDLSLMECLSETKDLDKAWEIFQPEFLDEKVQVVNQKKRTLSALYEDEDKIPKEVIKCKKAKTGKSLRWTQHACIQWVMSKLSEEELEPINEEAARMEKAGRRMVTRSLIDPILKFLVNQKRYINKIHQGLGDLEKTAAEIAEEIKDDEPYFLLEIKSDDQWREHEMIKLAIRRRFEDNRIPIVDGKFSTEWQH